MRLVAWVRPFDWCQRHDIPWKAHVEYDIPSTLCEKAEIWVRDTEYEKKVGPPRCEEESQVRVGP